MPSLSNKWETTVESVNCDTTVVRGKHWRGDEFCVYVPIVLVNGNIVGLKATL